MNNPLLISGFILGIAGAGLDFYSSSSFLSISTSTTTSMDVTTMHYNSSAEVWGIFFAILAAVLVITAMMSITRFGMKKMSLFGVLMMGYGIVMIFLGFLMSSGITPMMQQQSSTQLSSVGMFVVGALMLSNGLIMARSLSHSQMIEMK